MVVLKLKMTVWGQSYEQITVRVGGWGASPVLPLSPEHMLDNFRLPYSRMARFRSGSCRALLKARFASCQFSRFRCDNRVGSAGSCQAAVPIRAGSAGSGVDEYGWVSQKPADADHIS